MTTKLTGSAWSTLNNRLRTVRTVLNYLKGTLEEQAIYDLTEGPNSAIGITDGPNAASYHADLNVKVTIDGNPVGPEGTLKEGQKLVAKPVTGEGHIEAQYSKLPEKRF